MKVRRLRRRQHHRRVVAAAASSCSTSVCDLRLAASIAAALMFLGRLRISAWSTGSARSAPRLDSFQKNFFRPNCASSSSTIRIYSASFPSACCFLSATSRHRLSSRWEFQRFASSSSNPQSQGTTLDETRAAAVSNNNIANEKERIYEELKWVATELRRHDDLYYNSNGAAAAAVTSGEEEPAVPTARQQQQPPAEPMIISDDEYDALAEREAALCRAHPDLWHRWRTESGWGRLATRHRGRVGIASAAAAAASVEDEDEDEDAPNAVAKAQASTITTTTTANRKKQTHLHAMLSLDNVHTTEQLLAWLERVRRKLVAAGESRDISQLTIVTEPKLDGLSLSLRYERKSSTPPSAKDGRGGASGSVYNLQWASTRGDGRKGTDVTQAVRQMKSIPEQLTIAKIQDDDGSLLLLPDIVEVRGEVVMPKSVFEKLQNEYHQQQQQQRDAADNAQDGNESSSSNMFGISFSNARNAASGILQRYKEPTPNRTNETVDGSNGTVNTISTITEAEELRSQLRFYAYNIVTSSSSSTEDSLVRNCLETRRVLESQGFSVPEPTATTKLTIPINGTEEWTEKDIPNMMAYYEALGEFRLGRKASNKGAGSTKPKQQKDYKWGDFDVDGCVHKVAEGSARTLLGSSTRFPRWAIAHKFPPTAVVTELLDMEVQVGRTGALTPVAVLKPVDIAGVNVQRATLHNFAHMRQVLGGVDRILKGTSVLVRRAGDVIPQVVSRVSTPLEVEQSNELTGMNSTVFIALTTPTTCPACGSATSFDEANATPRSKSTVGQVLRCQGPPLNCPPRAVGAIRHAISRDTLEIKGLSEKRIEQLMNAGFLRRPSDIFALPNDDTKLQEIGELDGWGKKSVDNLVAEANRVATEGVSLARFIQSLGIRLVGSTASELMASTYGTAAEFLKDLEKAADLNVKSSSDVDGPPFSRLEDESESNKGIGPVLVASLWDFASQKEMVLAARELAQVIHVIDDTSGMRAANIDQANDSDDVRGLTKPLAGLSVVFAGSISGMTQAEAKKLAKSMGATATPAAVTRSTGLLVSGKKGGKKRDQAENLGVRLMEAEAFIILVEEFRATHPEALISDETTSKEDVSLPSDIDDSSRASLYPLFGLSVVITGSLPDLTRAEANKLAKEMGAKSTPSTISKSTGLVVIGEKAGPKKLEQSEKLGIRMIDADGFLQMEKSFRASLFP